MDLEIHKNPARKESDTASIYGGFLEWWYPTTMGFPIQNDHFGVFWGYHHLRKPPYRMLCFFFYFFLCGRCFPVRRYDASSATTGAAIADSIGSQAHAEWWCKCCCGDKGRLHHGNTQRMTIENQTIWRCISYLNMWLSSLPSWFFWGRPCFFSAWNITPPIWGLSYGCISSRTSESEDTWPIKKQVV